MPLLLSFARNIENRLATVSVGLSLALVAFVILTGQVVLYFWRTSIHSRDRLWTKGMIIFIWIMQALDIVLACHTTVLAHGNDSIPTHELINEILWEMGLYTGTCVITGCLVHAFFISRIYLLEMKPVCVKISLCIILILEGAFGFITMLSFIIPSLLGYEHVVSYWPVFVWLGISILADISIAASICYVLQKDRPIVSMRFKLLVKRLTKFCIQTGLITSLAAGITVAFWTAAQLDPGHLLMSFPTGSIYATCLMANLISRDSYLHHVQIDEDSECFEMELENIVFATPEDSKKNVLPK